MTFTVECTTRESGRMRYNYNNKYADNSDIENLSEHKARKFALRSLCSDGLTAQLEL